MAIPRFRAIFFCAVFALSAGLAQAEPVGTEFSFQGSLAQAGQPADGPFDFQFDLYDVQAGGAPVAATILLEDINVSEGTFVVSLDFGVSPFGGDKLWLEIGVRDGASTDPHTILEPRQVISPTPFAISALSVAPGAIVPGSLTEGSVSSFEILDESVSDVDIGPNAVSTSEIDSAQVQRRVFGSCPEGSAIIAINEDGSVVCAEVLQPFYSLSVVILAGTGDGTVESTPPGIDCPGDCTEVYDKGAMVSLEAQPDAFSTFDGWSGDCGGQGLCDLLMDAPRLVNASFSRCMGDALTGDADGDGWCADLDCDEGDPAINPGATELCAGGGGPNGVDENCNGYLDEICDGGCDPMDTDGDGISECDGDCDPDDGDVFPGNSEQCDGKDNDCNIFTIQNCEAGEACNFPPGPDDQADQCVANTFCTEIVDAGGGATGDHICSVLCSSTQTQGVGDQCAADATCFFDLLRSANVHICQTTQAALGSGESGSECNDDNECRSGICDTSCIGPGCMTTTCQDNCVSDADCLDPGSVCKIDSAFLRGRCVANNLPIIGVSAVGTACAADGDCDHGFCVDDNGSLYCSKGCKGDNSCPAGYACSLTGAQIDSGFTQVPPFSESCTINDDCESGFCDSGFCAWALTDTAPMCIEKTWPGTAGTAEACSVNSDCISNYCERNTQTCLNACSTEADCPAGTACTWQLVETIPGGTTGTSFATNARVCVSTPTVTIIQPTP